MHIHATLGGLVLGAARVAAIRLFGGRADGSALDTTIMNPELCFLNGLSECQRVLGRGAERSRPDPGNESRHPGITRKRAVSTRVGVPFDPDLQDSLTLIRVFSRPLSKSYRQSTGCKNGL